MKRNSRIALALGINAAVFAPFNAEPTIFDDGSPHVAPGQDSPDLLSFAAHPSRQWEYEKDALTVLRRDNDSAWAHWWDAFCRVDDLIAEIIDEFCDYPGWDAHRMHASDTVLDKMGRFVGWYKTKGYWYGWNIGERLEERYSELKSSIAEGDEALKEAEWSDGRLAEYRNRLSINAWPYKSRHNEFNTSDLRFGHLNNPRCESTKQLVC